jgi:hypothetical protein
MGVKCCVCEVCEYVRAVGWVRHGCQIHRGSVWPPWAALISPLTCACAQV